MIYNKDVAEKTAQFLLQIKAIKLNNTSPFHWASGWNSPIYCDNRKILSYPIIRTYIRQKFAEIIAEKFADVDVIAGVATGGIAIGALVAEQLGKPFIYIRPTKKEHGLQNQIEGELASGQSVMVVEDLISTGKSSLQAVEAIRDAGSSVKGMVAIFSYGFQLAEKNFKDADCELIILSDYSTIIDIALNENYIVNDDIEPLKEWRKAPEKWRQ